MSSVQDQLTQLGETIYKRQKPSPLPVLEHGSPAWRAWRQWRLDHDLPVAFMDRQQRWTVPTEWPPSDLDTALTSAAKRSSVASKLQLEDA